MKTICHTLIAYGNKNQSYTTQLLDSLNDFDENYHFVFCHVSLKTNEGIDVIQSKNLSIWKSFLCFLKLYFTDNNFKNLLKQLGFRKTRKWLELLCLKIDVLHLHHLHALPKELIDYFYNKEIKLITTLRGRDLLINTKEEIYVNEVFYKLKKMSAIHTISNYMEKELKSKFNLSSRIIYRGLNEPLKKDVKVSNEVLDVIKIIIVGRLVWEKGHIYIIESLNRLILKGYKFSIDIYGDGPLKEFLNFRIIQLGLVKSINLKGYVNNNKLKTIYKNYNLAVQPSLSEALSNGLIDFMMHDLPCVVSNVGGMTEVIIDNKNGIVFDISQPSDLDDSILLALDLNFIELKKFNNLHKTKFERKYEVKQLNNLYVIDD
jgi:glycosyltransferase involved in cell wall biosynthesis